ncbi:MAG: glycosyltransferase, partial [Flavobacteriales bacterium]
MKILYFSPHPNLGLNISSGPGTHMREVIAGFRDAGHEVETLIMGGEEALASGKNTTEKKGIKQRLKPIIPAYLWQTLKDSRLIKFDGHAKEMLLKKVVEFQPDLIYERGYYLMTSGVQVAKATGTKHFLEMNAPYPEEKIDMEGKSVFDSTAVERERYQVKSTDQLIVVSTALKEYYVEKCGIDSEKVIVTPNAINLEKIPNASSSLKKELFGDEDQLGDMD